MLHTQLRPPPEGNQRPRCRAVTDAPTSWRMLEKWKRIQIQLTRIPFTGEGDINKVMNKNKEARKITRKIKKWRNIRLGIVWPLSLYHFGRTLSFGGKWAVLYCAVHFGHWPSSGTFWHLLLLLSLTLSRLPLDFRSAVRGRDSIAWRGSSGYCWWPMGCWKEAKGSEGNATLIFRNSYFETRTEVWGQRVSFCL